MFRRATVHSSYPWLVVTFLQTPCVYSIFSGAFIQTF